MLGPSRDVCVVWGSRRTESQIKLLSISLCLYHCRVQAKMCIKLSSFQLLDKFSCSLFRLSGLMFRMNAFSQVVLFPSEDSGNVIILTRCDNDRCVPFLFVEPRSRSVSQAALRITLLLAWPPRCYITGYCTCLVLLYLAV